MIFSPDLFSATIITDHCFFARSTSESRAAPPGHIAGAFSGVIIRLPQKRGFPGRKYRRRFSGVTIRLPHRQIFPAEAGAVICLPERDPSVVWGNQVMRKHVAAVLFEQILHHLEKERVLKASAG